MMQSNEISESEALIRRLYSITTEQEDFTTQVDKLLALGCERFNLDIAILSKVTENRYQVQNVVCPEAVEISPGDSFDLESTYCEVTLKAQKPVGFEFVKHSELFNHPAYKAFQLESYIGMPITVNNKIYGTLNFSSHTPYNRKFLDVDIDALQLMAMWLSYSLSHFETTKKLNEVNTKLEKLATTDPLTTLLNRRAFEDQFNNQLNLSNRRRNCISLIMLDVDNFKRFNDRYGHQAGDEALVNIAKILPVQCRRTDLIGRFGGEEFILALIQSDEESSMKKAKEICHAVENLDCNEEKITVSIGIATYHPPQNPQQKVTPSQVLKQLISDADAALYHAKSLGKNTASHTKWI